MSKSDFGEPFQTILRASLTQRVRDGKWLGRVRWWSEKVSWGFVFSVSHCQHFFALGKTEGPDSVEIASRSRVGDLVYFELETDEGGLPFAKILRLVGLSVAVTPRLLASCAREACQIVSGGNAADVWLFASW